MKQKIFKRENGSIIHKHYENDKGEYHGLHIQYFYISGVIVKINYINGNRYGLETRYQYNSNKVIKQKYYL